MHFTTFRQYFVCSQLGFRVGSKITWHFVCKMSSLYGTFADRLCQVIFERSLTMQINEGDFFLAPSYNKREQSQKIAVQGWLKN